MVQPFSGNVEGPDSEPIAVRTLSDGKSSKTVNAQQAY